MVVIFWPAAAEIGVTHERMAAPLRCTVHAPQSAAPQPNFVPVMPSVSRKAQRMGVDWSALTDTSLPLMLRVGIVELLAVFVGRGIKRKKKESTTCRIYIRLNQGFIRKNLGMQR